MRLTSREKTLQKRTGLDVRLVTEVDEILCELLSTSDKLGWICVICIMCVICVIEKAEGEPLLFRLLRESIILLTSRNQRRQIISNYGFALSTYSSTSTFTSLTK